MSFRRETKHPEIRFIAVDFNMFSRRAKALIIGLILRIWAVVYDLPMACLSSSIVVSKSGDFGSFIIPVCMVV